MKCIYHRESFEFVGVQPNPANDKIQAWDS